jgi:hypothetical protein
MVWHRRRRFRASSVVRAIDSRSQRAKYTDLHQTGPVMEFGPLMRSMRFIHALPALLQTPEVYCCQLRLSSGGWQDGLKLGNWSGLGNCWPIPA